MSSNPLSIETLYEKFYAHLPNPNEGPHNEQEVTLYLETYSRLVAAHPNNTHTYNSPRIPSTPELMNVIELFLSNSGKPFYAVAAEAYTRIIVGRK